MAIQVNHKKNLQVNYGINHFFGLSLHDTWKLCERKKKIIIAANNNYVYDLYVNEKQQKKTYF